LTFAIQEGRRIAKFKNIVAVHLDYNTIPPLLFHNSHIGIILVAEHSDFSIISPLLLFEI